MKLMLEFKLNAHLGSSGWGEGGRWHPNTQKREEREWETVGSKRSQVPKGFLRPRGHLAEKAASREGEKARETARGREVEREETRVSEKWGSRSSSLHWRGSLLKSAGGDPTSIHRRIRVRVCVCVKGREEWKVYTHTHTRTHVHLCLPYVICQ